MKRPFILLVTVSCFFLSGCSGPGKDEITKAVQTHDRIELQKQLDKLALSAPGVGNVALKMSLPSPKNLVVTQLKTSRLVKNEKGDYETTVSYTLQIGNEKEKMVEKIILTNTKNGWKVIASEPL